MPKVTVVMPCLNEENYIGRALESLADAWVLTNGEILVVDGGSTDGTVEAVEKLRDKGFPIKILENKNRLTSFGLNVGIAEARGEIIVRADAHCLYPPGYAQKCIQLLETKGTANAGGVFDPTGEGGAVQEAVALAMKHPVGVGDARFRSHNYTGYAEGAFVGTYRRSLFDEVGYFDTKATPNEDSEMNLRIIKAGQKIWLDSSIKVTYFPRKTLKKLSQQYFKYGVGRAYTTFKHKKLTSWRQTGPPALVIGLIISLILGLFRPGFWLLPAAYIVTLGTVALLTWPEKRIPLKIRLILAAAFATMHISWGSGFISGLVARRS